MRSLTTAVVVLVVTLGLVSITWAGVEPTPWTPATNILNSMVNVLSEVDANLQNAFRPPSPNIPPGSYLVDQLEALTMQLDVLQARLQGVLDAVGTAPEPPDDFEQALVAVAAAAHGIVADARGFLPAVQDNPEAYSALIGLLDEAETIAGMADGSVRPG